MYFCIVKLAGCKSALNHTLVYSTDRSKAVAPVLVLLFLALWLIVIASEYSVSLKTFL